jgi:uncharacterized protein YceK
MPEHCRFALLVLALPFLAGCGTLSNLEGFSQTVWMGFPTEEPRPFGGVGNDCRMIGVMAQSELGWLVIPPLVVDLPVSLVGDVVTLPRVLWMRHEWSRAEQTGIWPEWARFNLQARSAVSAPATQAEPGLPVMPAKREQATLSRPDQ